MKRVCGANWIACVLMTAFIAAGCGSSASDVSTKAADQAASANPTLNVGSVLVPKSWDPARASYNYEFDAVQLVFAPLVRYPSRKVTGWLASDVSAVDGGREYEITLRKDATWSDGRPVTADDVVFTWRRNASKAFGSDYAYVMAPIEGFDEVNAGAPISKLGVEAIGERTVRVRLKSPVAWFERLLGLPVFTPVPSHVAAKSDWASDPTSMVHSGGYDITTVDGTAEAKLTARSDSWTLADVYPPHIVIRTFTQEASAWSAFRSGSVDFVTDMITPNTDPEVAETKGVVTEPSPYVAYYIMRNRGSLADLRLRKLVYRTLDAEQYLKDTKESDAAVPAQGFIPGGVPGAKQVNRGAIAPEELPATDAGGVRVRLGTTLSKFGWNKEMKRQLEAVGFKVELVTYPGSDEAGFLDWSQSDEANLDLVRQSWIGDYPDPHTFLSTFTCGGIFAFGNCDREFDKLVERAAVTSDDDERFDLERRALARLNGTNGTFTAVPVAFYTRTVACNKNVECGTAMKNPADIYYDTMYAHG